jgi:hypothetical protein
VPAAVHISEKKFDLDGYIPTPGTKAKLISECEAIECNESVKDKEHKDDNDNNNNNKKNKLGKFETRAKKDDRPRNVYFYCKNCGHNRTHDTSKCFFLKDKTQRFEKRNLSNNNDASKKDRLFSRCTFHKEVNTLARKAIKKNALGLYASTLKRRQDKESKAKQAKRPAIESEDSSLSKDSMSVHNLEKPIPRKQHNKSPFAKANPKSKLVKKADGKKKNKEIDIGFLSAVKRCSLRIHYLVSKTLTSVPMNSPMKTPPKAATTQMHLPKDTSVLLSHRISSLQVATTRHPPPKVTTLMTSITSKNTPPKNTPIPRPPKATTRTKTLPTVIILMISQPAMISMFSPRFRPQTAPTQLHIPTPMPNSLQMQYAPALPQFQRPTSNSSASCPSILISHFLCYLTCQMFYPSFHRIFRCPTFTCSTCFQIILAKA